MIETGQRLFEFEIVRPLGEGGFARVYEAKDIMLNRSVAIKLLRTDKSSDQRNLKRFVQEARATSLEHPNIVTIYGMRVQDKKFYMIMEYLPGGSLQDLLKAKGKLPVEQAIQLTIGICEGLACFHDKGIIHRDIKAENILFTADTRPKVADLGIAHVPTSAGGLGVGEGLTQVGFQPSTLLFSSPEQLRGEELDPRSDVYQVGELLYYMLFGQHYINIEFIEHTALTQERNHQVRAQMKMYELLEKAICYDMPIGLKVLWRQVGALAGVVERALAKDKTERFQDTREMAAALRAFSVTTTPTASATKKAPQKLTLQNSRAYNKRGLAHVSMRNYEQAVIDYSKALELDPNFVEGYHNRAIVYLLMDNYGQAFIDCNKALELAPDFVPGYTNRGIAYTGLRHYDMAFEDYQKALDLSPKNVHAFYNRANTHLWQGDLRDAVADYSQAIQYDKNFVAAYVNRGVAHTEMENYDLAIIDYSQAIELNDKYILAYYNRAYANRKLAYNEAAIQDYTKVIELNAEHPYAFLNRADAFMAVGDSESFEADYSRGFTKKSSSIDPRHLNVARSMLMPASPLNFLTHED